VSLTVARTINGLRAVFGEVYPDPVRVVSIGAPVTDILKDPSNPKWRSYSVEFCGGTHLNNLKEAENFYILSDESIAKGIRRIIGITGKSTQIAFTKAERLQEQINNLPKELTKSLETLVIKLQQEMDTLQIPLTRKLIFRQTLTSLRVQIVEEFKRIKALKIQKAIELSQSIAEQVSKNADPVLIAEIELGSEKGALNEAIKNIQVKCENTSIMLFSTDEESDQTIVYAVVPKSQQTKLKAGDWMKAVLTELGGKGGGSAETGTGNLPGGRDLLHKALLKADQFAKNSLK